MTEPDKKDVVPLLMAAMTIVAVAVLLIDWKIKQDILTAAKRAQEQYDLLERRYYGPSNSKHIDGDSRSGDQPGSGGNHGLVGIAGMATATGLAEDTDDAHAKARENNRAVARARSARMEVPPSD